MSQDASAYFLLILLSFLGLDSVLCGRDLLADEYFSGWVHWLDPRQVPHDLLKSPLVLNASAAGSDPLRIKYRWGESLVSKQRLWAKNSVGG